MEFNLQITEWKAAGARVGVAEGSRGERGDLNKERNLTLDLFISFTKRLMEPSCSPGIVVFVDTASAVLGV